MGEGSEEQSVRQNPLSDFVAVLQQIFTVWCYILVYCAVYGFGILINHILNKQHIQLIIFLIFSSIDKHSFQVSCFGSRMSGVRISPPRPVQLDQSFQNTVFIDVFWLVNINFQSCNELIFEFSHDLWSRFWSRFELSPVHLFVKVRYENIPNPKEIWFFWLLPFSRIYSKGPHRSL